MYYVCIVVCIGAHIYLSNNDNIHMIFTCARCWPVDRCVLADSQWEPSQSLQLTCRFVYSARTPQRDVHGTPWRICQVSFRRPNALS